MTESAISFNADNPEQPGFHTVKETACYLRLCEKQVRRLISRGELRAYRFGTALRIKKKDIDAYAEAQRIYLD
jgi:excisionase family DNA binding protein